MKPFYKSTAIFCLVLLISLRGESQLINENFNTGLPANWTQSPASSWSLSANLGTSSSSCVYCEDLTISTGTVSISTPTLNLNSVSNLTVTFQAAVVGNNFIVPDLALYYDAGSGPQFQARWGSGFSPNTTYTVTGGYDYTPPLDSQNVWWISCTQTISAISGTMASFRFDAEPLNGGYVLIDDVVIMGKAIVTTGIEEKEEIVRISVFPNPTLDKKLRLEGRDIKAIQVSDAQGRTFKVEHTKTDDGVEIDLHQFQNGVYYLTATKKDNVLLHKKIVVE